MKNGVSRLALILGSSFLMAGIAPAYAQSSGDISVQQRVNQLETELSELKQQIEANSRKTDQALRASKPKALPDTIWHLAGYAWVGYEGGVAGENDAFTAGSFNPVFHFQYKDKVMIESELEIEVESDGSTEFEMEYTTINLMLNDSVTLVAGKFISPVGQFQERLHPAWINKMTDAPAGFGHGGAQPLSDVGLQVRGGIPIGSTTLTYAAGVGNGPRVGHDGLELEGFGGDNNSNKSLVGRVGFLPVPYFEVGASYLNAEITGEEDHDIEPTKGTYSLWGADAAFTKGNWDVRFEIIDSHVQSFITAPPADDHGDEGDGHEEEDDEHEEEIEGLFPATDWQAWYVQAAYRLSGITDNRILGRFEPAVRYGQYKIKGNHELAEDSEKRFNIGLNYWIAPSVVAKIGVEWRNFNDEDRKDDTTYMLQLAYGF